MKDGCGGIRGCISVLCPGEDEGACLIGGAVLSYLLDVHLY